jgi:hypothetical protein
MPTFGERIIPVDTAVARRSVTLHVPDPQPVRDSLIAATALVHGLVVVTRNVADFEPTGTEIIDPWQRAGEVTWLSSGSVADSTQRFTLMLAGLKALLEHGIPLNLTADRYPGGHWAPAGNEPAA